MMDDRIPLIKKLADLMPKAAAMSPEYVAQITPRFEVDHIRMAADAFAHIIDGDLPKDARELTYTLYVFGQVLNGEMQRRMNHMQKLHEDMLYANATPAAQILGQRPAKQPCSDCVDGWCTMNCGPTVK